MTLEKDRGRMAAGLVLKVGLAGVPSILDLAIAFAVPRSCGANVALDPGVDVACWAGVGVAVVAEFFFWPFGPAFLDLGGAARASLKLVLLIASAMSAAVAVLGWVDLPRGMEWSDSGRRRIYI